MAKSFQIKMSYIALILVGILILLWLIVSFYRAYQPKKNFLQGQISAREYNVSSKLAGRIEDVYVKKGDKITKGQRIFSIEIPELEAKFAQAKAGYEAAKALNDETQKGSRAEAIQSTKSVWQAAQAMRELSEKSYHRIEQLFSEGVISLQKRDEAYTAYQSALYNEDTAYQQYKIASDGAREETKEAAAQKEAAALGQLHEVEVYMRDKDAFAPSDGEVSNILIHQGELAPSGFPVVKIVDLKDAWLRISIPEYILNRFNVGSEFEGYIPALDRKVRFKVFYVSVMGDFATWKATTQKGDYDMKTYEINAHILHNNLPIRMGMSVLVEE